MFQKIVLISLVILLMPFAMRASSIFPSILELSGGRGETLESSFTLVNQNVDDQDYYLDTINFKPHDETGTPEFFSDNTQGGFRQWIQFPANRVLVPARSKVEVPLLITVPPDVKSGGYYAAITVSQAPAEIVATNGAAIEAKTALLVLFTVKGETVLKAGLLDFVEEKPHLIKTDLQGRFVYRVQNQGNVHITPKGQITFNDIFGRTVLTSDVNSIKSRVLPMSTRKFSVDVDGVKNGFLDQVRFQASAFAIGPITATLLIAEEGLSPMTAHVSFFLLPIQLILVVIGMIIILFLGYRLVSKKVLHR